MQKKKFLFFLCLALLFVFVGCSNKKTEPVNISGNYILEKINDDTKIISDFEKYTLDITKENAAKLVIKMKGNKKPIKMNGIAKIENSDVTIDFQDESTSNFVGEAQDNKLILTDTVSNMEYTFTKK